jgi:hypothetical protein
VAVYRFTQLIQPGIRREKVWFQSLPQGKMAVVYWEGDDPRSACESSLRLRTPSTGGSRSAGERSTTFEPSQTLEEDEEVFEAEVS